jgi:hypothetical protein
VAADLDVFWIDIRTPKLAAFARHAMAGFSIITTALAADQDQ